MLKRSTMGVLLMASSLLMVPLSAQTATDRKPAMAQDDEVIQLDPFTITTDKDTGYKASNSIAGTRSNTPIKDIPLNLQVFTKDLVADLIVTDQTALERYNAALVNGGADVQSDNNIQQQYGAFIFRGFIQNWGMRDGIREYDPIDAQGLARVEIVKGPAAALYGLSYAGGIMNSITKRVDMTNSFGSVRLTYSDVGAYRATVDANYVGKAGGGKFGVRFNGANAATEDKREHSKGKTNFAQTNLEFQPWTGTSIALLIENSWRQKPVGLGYYTRAGGTSASKPASQELGVGVSIPLQVDHPEIPWTWNWANADNNRSLEAAIYRGTITQSIGEDFHVTAYLQSNRHQNIDSNGWNDNQNSLSAASWDVAGWSENGCVPTGWLNPGASNETIRKVYHWRDWSNRVHALGLTAVYKFDIASVKNTVTAGGANWDERFFSNKWLQPSTTTDTFDLPVRAGINTDAPAGGAPGDFKHNKNEGGREHSQNRYFFASWQLSALDNRLKLNAAVNSTKINNIAYGSISAVNHNGRVSVSKTSPMIGGMFDITKEVSIFAVHSTSLFPTTDKNDFNQPMPPEVGKSNEIGVKVELLEGKISGTVSYYKITRTGGGVQDPAAINQNKLLWDSFSDAQRLSYFPGLTRDQLRDRAGNLGDLVPAELESKGFEADLVFQPISSLQIVTSYANNNEQSTKGATKGDTVTGHIKQQFSVLTKYTFNDGAAKGLSLGLGFQHAGKALQDYTTGSNGVRVQRFNPATNYAEFFAGYKFKAFGYNNVVQFNAKNLTKQDDFIGWKPTGNAGTVATERYGVPTYARYSITWGLDF